MDSNSKEKLKKEKSNGHGKSGKKKVVIGISAVLVLVLAVASYFIYDLYFKKDVVTDSQVTEFKQKGVYVKGISINGIDISGKTYTQAKELLEESEKEEVANISYTLKNEHGTVAITSEDFVYSFNTDEVLIEALKFGKEGTSADKKAAQAELDKGKNFDLTIKIDKEATLAKIDTKLDPLSKAATDPTISIASNQTDLIYKEGSVGYTVDVEAVNKLITEQLDAGNLVATITAPTTTVQPTGTVEDLKKNSSLISTYKTTYTGSAGRKANVVKAAKMMNGIEVKPGEKVSVNDVLGPRIAGKGWSMAPAIVGGSLQEELGGGVCQVSSTLYNALLMADVTIVQRSPHSQVSSYVPIGRDATISTGGPDLVFRNDSDHSIFVFSIVDTKKCTVTFRIYGKPLDNGVTISLTSQTIATLQPTSAEVITVDNTKPAGYEEIVIKRSVGYKAQTYKNYIQNGKVIKTVLVSTDTYPARSGKRIVGPAATATPTPSASLTPTKTP